MAAKGHYGNKSPFLVKHISQDLGFKYLTASDKESFLANMKIFIDPDIGERSMVFEVFTDALVEDEAFRTISNIHPDMKARARETTKKILGEKNVQKLKSIFRK